MSWSRFARFLKTQPFDRRTKLLLIDLLTTAETPAEEEDLFAFVFAWEEAQASIQATLLEGIRDITTQYQHRIRRLASAEQTSTLAIADDLQKQKHIHAVRNLISTL